MCSFLSREATVAVLGIESAAASRLWSPDLARFLGLTPKAIYYRRFATRNAQLLYLARRKMRCREISRNALASGSEFYRRSNSRTGRERVPANGLSLILRRARDKPTSSEPSGVGKLYLARAEVRRSCTSPECGLDAQTTTFWRNVATFQCLTLRPCGVYLLPLALRRFATQKNVQLNKLTLRVCLGK